MPPSHLLRFIVWFAILPVPPVVLAGSGDGAAEVDRPASALPSFIPYLHANGRFGFVDGEGQAPFANTFEDAQPFSEGRAAVKSGGKWGYIDPGGQWIVRPRFTEAASFENGEARAAIVKPPTRSGFIDLNPFHTSGSRKCYLIASNGHARACGDESSDVPASDRASEESSNAPRFREVRAPDGKSHGVIDADGRQIVPFGVYDDLRYQDGSLFVAHRAGGWGILDASRNVEIVIADRPGFDGLKYTSPLLVPRLLAVLRDDGTWCVLDRTGRELHCGLGDVSHWGESLIAASNGQKRWGAIDTRWHPIIPFRYDSEFRFRNGLARVRLDGAEFYIDARAREYRTRPAPD